MAKIGNSDYDFEFDEPVNLLSFCGWLAQNGQGFANNLVGRYGGKPKPLHEWISWFLDWTEYSDYVERKKNE